MWGGRLGTALVELGHVKLDDLSVALGRQYGLPAALQSHFDRADDSLATLVSASVAEKYGVVPLVRAGKRIIVAVLAPLDEREIAIVADELAVAPDRVVQAIAPELRIRYFLESVYHIPRPQRFLRQSGGSAIASERLPHFTTTELESLDPPSVTLGIPVAIPDLSDVVPPPPVQARTATRERRKYLATLADMLQGHPDEQSGVAHVERIAGIPGRELQAAASLSPPDPGALARQLTLIERGRDRDDVARLAMDTLAKFEGASHSALLLTVRGSAAASWTGFCRDGTPLPALAVPLEQPGIVPAVMKRRATTRGASGDLTAIDYLLLASLGVKHGDLVVVPIEVADQVVAMLALATPQKLELECAEAVASAIGRGFARLMREVHKSRR